MWYWHVLLDPLLTLRPSVQLSATVTKVGDNYKSDAGANGERQLLGYSRLFSTEDRQGREEEGIRCGIGMSYLILC